MISSRSKELDTLRQDVLVTPPDEENYRLRVLWLKMWVCMLQQHGVDLDRFVRIDHVFVQSFVWNLCRSSDGQNRRLSDSEMEELQPERAQLEWEPIANTVSGAGLEAPAGRESDAAAASSGRPHAEADASQSFDRVHEAVGAENVEPVSIYTERRLLSQMT